jgi:hypothetical protein
MSIAVINVVFYEWPERRRIRVFYTRRVDWAAFKGGGTGTVPGASFLGAPKCCGQKYANFWIIELLKLLNYFEIIIFVLFLITVP